MAPDKLYLSHLIYDAFQYQAPDPDDETQVEYIRKDYLLTWLEGQRGVYEKWLKIKDDPVRWGQRNALQQVIETLNCV